MSKEITPQNNVTVPDDLRKAVQETLHNNELTCPEARAIAERLGYSYAEVGQAIDRLGVKIRHCSLGCF